MSTRLPLIEGAPDEPLWIDGRIVRVGDPPGRPVDVQPCVPPDGPEGTAPSVLIASEEPAVFEVEDLESWLIEREVRSALAFHRAHHPGQRVWRHRLAKWLAAPTAPAALVSWNQPTELTPAHVGQLQVTWQGHRLAAAVVRHWSHGRWQSQRTDDDGRVPLSGARLICLSHMTPSAITGADWQLWVVTLALPAKTGAFTL